MAVDDAHLVDPLSAALLHHLASTSAVRLLVAIRSGEPTEDAITALWRDGTAERIDLQPLGVEDVAALLRAVLDGDIDGPSARRLWRVTGGNPLYLHEVVTEALRAGTLDLVHGVWLWRGNVHIGARLRELVELRLATLDDDERELVALLAVGDAVKAEVVEQAASPHAIARLQRRGFVVATSGDEPAQLSLDHPLFAEVVRTSMPIAERTRWCRFLAESSGLDERDDVAVLRRAMWTIDGGVTTDAELLTRAAELANKRWDGALADQLARAAIAAGAGPRALLVRGDACFKLGRYRDSMSHLSAIDEALLDEEQLAHLAMLLAETGFWGLGRAADTEAALDRIARRLERRGSRERVRALRSAVMFAANDLAGASDVAFPIASDATADELARLRAVTAAAGCLSFSGHPQSALELCDTLLPIGFEHANESQRGVGWVVAAMVLAYNCLGRFEEAEQRRRRSTRRRDHRRRRRSGRQRDPRAREARAQPRRTRTRAFDGAGGGGCAARVRRGGLSAVEPRDRCAGRGSARGRDRRAKTPSPNSTASIGRCASTTSTWRSDAAWAAVASGEVTTPVRILIDAAAEARRGGQPVRAGTRAP